MRMEKKRTRDILSRRMKAEARATKIGVVVTKITELATEVYLRELIQKAKWKQRKSPAPAEGRISFRANRRDSRRVFGKASKRRIRVARVRR
jgi:hypothetical protein